jgi:dolichyl-phosphate beta-glucosyltransferase
MCDSILVVPCYNEERRLDVEAYLRDLQRHEWLELLFVDDGSVDNTWDTLQRLRSAAGVRVTLLQLATNCGKAEAVRQGVLLSFTNEPKYVGYWDADLATPLDEVCKLRYALNSRPDAQMALGARVKMLGRRIARHPARHYLGRLFATAVSTLFNIPVYDSQCGAKLIRNGGSARQAFAEPFASRWIFDVELLCRLRYLCKHGLDACDVFYEVPLDSWKDVRGSKLQLTDMCRAAWDLACMWKRERPSRISAAGAPTIASHEEAKPKPRVRKPSVAFTLLELLVVIVVVGLLLAMLLPAVQMAREAARRSQCQSQLRQIAMALHQYHDMHTCLPINMGPWPPLGTAHSRPLNGKGWIVGILPFLDEQPLFESFATCFRGDFFAGAGIKVPAGLALMQTQLHVLQCPSDGSAKRLSSIQFQWEGHPVAVTSYKGVMGDTTIGGPLSIHAGSLPDCHAAGGCNGLFFRTTYSESQNLAYIVDGTSHTLLVGEDIPEHNNHSAAFYSNSDYASCHARLNYLPDPPTPDEWPNVMSFRSRHPKGASFCTGDGSVHFVSETIEHTLYRALSTKHGAESVQVP